MRLSFKSISVAALLFTEPGLARAQQVAVDASGAVTTIQSVGTDERVSVGDASSLQFLFDPAAAGSPNILALGGGTSTSYDVLLTNLTYSIGSYSWTVGSLPGTLYYQDDVFGQDGFGFGFYLGEGGPFESTFSNVQLQFRASSTDTLNSGGIANGLPVATTTTDIFGIFGGGPYANVRASNVSVSIAPAGAVPESATWAMMLIGFGAIGFSMRRKQHLKVTSGTACPA